MASCPKWSPTNSAMEQVPRRPLDGAAKPFSRHFNFCADAQQGAAEHRQGRRRDHQLEAFGIADQAAPAPDPGLAILLFAADHLIGEPGVAKELHRPGFGRQPAIGSRFHGEAVEVLGQHDSAESGLRFEEAEGDAGALQVKRGSQAGESAACDDYHGVPDSRRPSHKDREQGSRFELSNHLDYGLDVIHGSFGKDAVAEVEDMAWARPGTAQQLVDADF